MLYISPSQLMLIKQALNDIVLVGLIEGFLINNCKVGVLLSTYYQLSSA